MSIRQSVRRQVEDKPSRRRWPRFKLSTILVLVGILAWLMAYRPQVVYSLRDLAPAGPMAGVTVFWDGALAANQDMICLSLNYAAGQRARNVELNVYFTPWQAACPMLALAAFLTCKWVAARRKRRREGML